MDFICVNCGKKIRFFDSDPLDLTDKKVMCHECAKPIEDMMLDLEVSYNKDQFATLQRKIIETSKSIYSEPMFNLIKKTTCDIGTSKFGSADNGESTQYDSNSNSADCNVSNSDTTAFSSYEPSYNKHHSNDSGMFANIGMKIKGLATFITIVGIIASVITGVVFMSLGDDMGLIGLLIMLGGSLLSWISSFVLYGFGHLITNSDEMLKITREKFKK